MQGFTCVAVPNAARWAGFTPVFVDCDNTYNLDIKDAKRKLTPNTKAIIIQHTFGIPADIKKLTDWAKKEGLFVIEDCAHAFGGTYENRPLGTWGDAAILSYGRDKTFSSVFGGAAITKNEAVGEKLAGFENSLKPASRVFVVRQLLYGLNYSVALHTYNLIVGRVFLRCLRALGILSPAVFEIEKSGKMPEFISFAYDPSLCYLANTQMKNFDAFVQHRTTISNQYIQSLSLSLPLHTPYLRIPVTTKNKRAALNKAKSVGVHLGNWYRGVIDPLESMAYFSSTEKNLNKDCPNALRLSTHTINLPTHVNTTSQEADKVIGIVKTLNDFTNI